MTKFTKNAYSSNSRPRQSAYSSAGTGIVSSNLDLAASNPEGSQVKSTLPSSNPFKFERIKFSRESSDWNFSLESESGEGPASLFTGPPCVPAQRLFHMGQWGV